MRTQFKGESLARIVLELGVCKRICDVLIASFPEDEFTKHLGLFKDALNQPNSLQLFISELQKQLNTGATSHTAHAMYRFLAMDNNFDVFTRDYVRRCCDMVEYITKRKVAFRFDIEHQVEKLPLGGVIRAFSKYSMQFPDGLLDALAQFNMAIYRPAKHDHVN